MNQNGKNQRNTNLARKRFAISHLLNANNPIFPIFIYGEESNRKKAQVEFIFGMIMYLGLNHNPIMFINGQTENA